MGALRLEGTAATTPLQLTVEVNVRRVVDVDVPTLKVIGEGKGLTYGFVDTSSTLDDATRTLQDVLPSICKAAEVENAIFRLATELEKTQRLINALEFIIIPSYGGAIKYISATLEEREREEFVRLKHVKNVLETRKEQ